MRQTQALAALTALFAASLPIAPSALAQTPTTPGEETACSAVAAPPAELSGWGHAMPLAAAGAAENLDAARLTLGHAAAATLPRTPEVTYALRPEKPGGSVSYGGLFAFDVPKAGTYIVALSTGAWIDVVRDGKAVESTAHGRGPACTGIRKMVTFPLEPGRHVIQIAANGAPDLSILVAERP
ncbi:homogentisate 1,2-dioxygenase [Phenylobacterium sp.]|uniref:homogentisate 1,2-dioxygenase n=1 Tax=Phenylobacterium sp. TaxID=1871053 RepID=UPI00301CD61A